MNNWYEVKNIEQVDTPSLLFYPERIKKNIATAKSFIDDIDRLRPHVKTHKCVEVTNLMLEAGITKFKCATIAEAEMLAISGASDVLLAYQPVFTKAKRLTDLIVNYQKTKFSCLIDNIDSAVMLSGEAERVGIVITVFIDVNIGMNRTGVLPAQVLKLYERCSNLKNLTIRGLHAYDGHIYTPDLQQRTLDCHFAYQPIEQLISQIEAQGYAKPVIVAGGTPTYPIFAKMPEVECSPGTFILWDEGYRVQFSDLPFLPAAIVATRVISVLDANTICLDMGHKAIAAENDLHKRVKFLNAPDATFIAHSEEHLVIKTSKANQFKIGDVLYGLPMHICPTCNLYREAIIVNNDEASAEWQIIARDRKINF
ncbi:MAG: D-TA family PLP-dependent enzyme [Sphingobacteriaceae bacterium]|nr:MAG: D-TA family PLP-dependent enzyme [Sphingobacteriaceae bacterium]